MLVWGMIISVVVAISSVGVCVSIIDLLSRILTKSSCCISCDAKIGAICFIRKTGLFFVRQIT